MKKIVTVLLLMLAYLPSQAQVVMYEVYGAGGNAGAAYTNDYVVLHNNGSSSVNLSTYSIQYASASGTTWTKVNLSGTIVGYGFFLIQLASGGANGSALPTPDFSSGTINMATANGKVALVSNQTALTGNPANPLAAPIVDFIGFGTANTYEGAGAAPAPSATNATGRNTSTSADTNVNSADFAARAANPINSSAALLPIELADFTAQATKDMVTLNWQTISEVNSDVFEVQHLVDGAWKTVATVQAAGSSTDVRSYTQAIQGLQVGTHYFRLKSVGKDGGVKYSKQVTVSVEVPGTFVMNPAYPNPFNPQTTLTFAVSQKQAVTMTLFNALGQQISVLYQGVPEANTLQTIQLNGSTLQSGAYFVRLMGENFSGMQKVMLVK